jgi:hypothetical protein
MEHRETLKRILTGSVMLVLSSMAASTAMAAVADCNAVNTLQDLINDNALGGCQHLDKIFSNFVYSGTGAQAANLVDATHEFTANGVNGVNDVHGWLFQLSGGWTTGFTLSYTITVDTNCLTDTNCGSEFGLDTSHQVIVASVDQEQSGLTPNNTAITDTQVIAGVLHVMGTSPSAETAQITYAAVTTIHTSSVYTTSGTSGLQSYEQDWFEASNAVPESATMGLCGAGLLLLGWLGKRRAAR